MSKRDQYVTVKELAHSHGVCPGTIRGWMRKGYVDVRRLAPKTYVRVRLSRIRERQ